MQDRCIWYVQHLVSVRSKTTFSQLFQTASDFSIRTLIYIQYAVDRIKSSVFYQCILKSIFDKPGPPDIYPVDVFICIFIHALTPLMMHVHGHCDVITNDLRESCRP